MAIVYTSSGYIKRTSLTSYKFQARGGKGRKGIEMKAEDVVEDIYVCSTHSYLLVFTNQGRLYWLKALDVPDVGVSGRGKPIANLVEFQPGEKPASVVAVKEFSENQFVVMLTTDGVIKKTRLSEFRNVRKGGILAMNIRPKSELFSAQLSTGKNTVVIGTRLGRALQFKEADVRPMGRSASGVRGIRLKPKDRVIGMIVVGAEEKFIFTATERGYGKKTSADMYPIKHRGGQGVLNLRSAPRAGPPRASASSSSTTRTGSAPSPRSGRAEPDKGAIPVLAAAPSVEGNGHRRINGRARPSSFWHPRLPGGPDRRPPTVRGTGRNSRAPGPGRAASRRSGRAYRTPSHRCRRGSAVRMSGT
ncbi:MAG: hypothetical protein MUE80_02830 [Acidobacteria bacterium]|nr:hypothetical protein [Acidobacteriota bacterium]